MSKPKHTTRREFIKIDGLVSGTMIGSQILAGCKTAPLITDTEPVESFVYPTPSRVPTATAVPSTATSAPPIMLLDVLEPGQELVLPAPQLDENKSLARALRSRQSKRSFGTQDMPLQVVSNLLWAAFGINRPGSGGRTAPSAVNSQEIDVYVATAKGLYLYDAKLHTLKPVSTEDIRAATGSQSFVKSAALNLVYVADFARVTTGGITADKKNHYAAVSAGCIGQNVYLYCASEGLATVMRDMIDRDELAKAMQLDAKRHVIMLTQSVGYPPKSG